MTQILPGHQGNKIEAKPSAAVFVDLENMAYRSETKQEFNIQYVLERIQTTYHPIVRRVYADWNALSRFSQCFQKVAFEQIQIYASNFVKNSLDMQMSVDILDTVIHYPGIEAFVLVTGDSDFCPVVRALRRYGKTIWGVSWSESAGWAFRQHCDQFFAYDDLAPAPTYSFQPSPLHVATYAAKPELVTELFPEQTVFPVANEPLDPVQYRKLLSGLRRKNLQLTHPHLHQRVIEAIYHLAKDSEGYFSKSDLITGITKGSFEYAIKERSLSLPKIAAILQILINAGCFDQTRDKAQGAQLLMLKPEFQDFHQFRQQHDNYLRQIATEVGVSFSDAVWTKILYGKVESA